MCRVWGVSGVSGVGVGCRAGVGVGLVSGGL